MRWLGALIVVFLSACKADESAKVCQADRSLYEYESLDIDPEEWHQLYRFDDSVIYVNYPDHGWMANPVTSAQYALASYNYFLSKGDPKYHEAFLQQAEYLISSAQIVGNAAVWPYDFGYAPYQLDAGWWSGLAQGQVLSVLVRRYVESPSPKLKELMRQAIEPMMLDRKDGGLLARTPEGGVWIEEYPSKEPSLVLNGFVFAIIGLADYLRAVPDDVEVSNFNSQLLSSLKLSLDKYEFDDWLAYDRVSFAPVNQRYVYIQVRQMSQLYRFTEDDFFSRRCSKWTRYEHK